MNLEKLEQARECKGKSVAELCREMNICRSTWYKWIKGEMNPTADKLARLCNILNIDITDII